MAWQESRTTVFTEEIKEIGIDGNKEENLKENPKEFRC